MFGQEPGPWPSEDSDFSAFLLVRPVAWLPVPSDQPCFLTSTSLFRKLSVLNSPGIILTLHIATVLAEWGPQAFLPQPLSPASPRICPPIQPITSNLQALGKLKVVLALQVAAVIMIPCLEHFTVYKACFSHCWAAWWLRVISVTLWMRAG